MNKSKISICLKKIQKKKLTRLLCLNVIMGGEGTGVCVYFSSKGIIVERNHTM